MKCAVSESRYPCGVSEMNFYSAGFVCLDVANVFAECSSADAFESCLKQPLFIN
jgi:hypothetical protein